MKRNKFSKALKHLKSKKIDDKIKSLEEAGPTNSMSGVYQVTPDTGDGFRMGPGDPDKKFYPKQDGTWPSGIPANASDTVYVRKGGYFEKGKGTVPSNQTPTSRDFTYDDVTANGTTNTNTLIRPSDGKPYTALPEGTESFILGPLVGNYAINHGTDDYTNIGYIQKDTRQFVLLARIDGFFKGEDRPRTSYGGGNARTFDGTASQFTSYNSNFKLEHALWMLDRYNKNDFANNFPFNFSGGVPVERHPDNNSMGMGVIMGILNALFGGNSDNIGTPQDPADSNDINSLNLMGLLSDLLNKGKDIISKFGDFAMDPFGSIADFVKNDVVDLYDKFSDTALSNDVLEPAFEKFGQILGSKKGALLGLLTTAASDIRAFVGDKYSDFGDKPAFSTSDNPYSWAANLAMSLAQSIGNGRPVVCDNSCVSSSTVAPFVSVDDINMMFDSNSDIQNGPPNIASDADSILNPNKNGDNKKPYMGDGFGGEGGSIMTPFTDGKGNYFIMNVADKTLRVGGESGEGFDINTQTFTDIPSGGNATSIVNDMVNSGKFADGLTSILNQQTDDANYNTNLVNNLTDTVKNSDTFNNLMTVLDNETVGGSFVSGYSTGTVNGAAAGSLLYEQLKIKLGLMKPTDLQQAGGHGHVSRQTVINVNDLNPEVKAQFFSNYGIQESVVYGSKKRILREIRQPLREIQELPKTTKLKGYKPNFKGKFSPQNTPDVTASKKSDDIVSGKNASRQIWTAKDKYWKGYETTERMNIIFDRVGFGSIYFNEIAEGNKRAKQQRSREVQEHLNMLAHEKTLREVYSITESPFRKIEESETYDNKVNDPLFSKVANRLKKEIDYPKKPSPKGYPNEAPPKIDPNTGMHPKFGKRYKYDKLDPQSAEGMPMQGDPEIDANIEKATDSKRKARKLKNLLGKK